VPSFEFATHGLVHPRWIQEFEKGAPYGERKGIIGSGGKAPSGLQEQSSWLGGQGTKPPEAESIFYNKWLSCASDSHLHVDYSAEIILRVLS